MASNYYSPSDVEMFSWFTIDVFHYDESDNVEYRGGAKSSPLWKFTKVSGENIAKAQKQEKAARLAAMVAAVESGQEVDLCDAADAACGKAEFAGLGADDSRGQVRMERLAAMSQARQNRNERED